MSRTRLQLVNQAATRLGILASGQTLVSDDYDVINDLWEPLAEELGSRRVYVVGDVENVDDGAFLRLADLLAIEAAPSFGVTAQSLAAKGLDKRITEDALEVIASGDASKRVLTVEKFWG